MALGLGALMLLSGIASGVGGLLSSGLQLGSQAWSQDFNRKEAEKAREFSHNEAILNRDFEAQQAELTRQWQTDMSNTAYQRSMADMKSAGLNPNLMASGAASASTGNASTPQGSQAQSNAASSGALGYNNVFSGLSSALNAFATIKNQELIAKMYNDTSRSNNLATNNMRKYGVDRSSTAYENVNFNNFYKDYKNKMQFYEYLKAHKYD